MTDTRTFICNPIREHDSQGNLRQAGLEWNEGSAQNHNDRIPALLLLGLGVVMALIVIAFGAGAIGGGAVLIGVILGAIPAAPAIWMLSRSAPKRAIIFTADDKTLIPHGFRKEPKVRQSEKFRPSQITSVEYETDEGMPGTMAAKFFARVRLVSKEGDIADIASDLHKDQALKVNAQVTKAWQDILDSAIFEAR